MVAVMALNAQAVIDILKRYKITADQLGPAIDRNPETVYNWCSGVYTAPPYLERTVQAVVQGLVPVSKSRMIHIGAVDLSMMLGVPISSARYWISTHGFPRAARLAVASFRQPEIPSYISGRELRFIRRLDAARHYRTHNGYRARPILGKRLPMMKRDIITELKIRGLVYEDDRGGVVLTTKARNFL